MLHFTHLAEAGDCIKLKYDNIRQSHSDEFSKLILDGYGSIICFSGKCICVNTEVDLDLNLESRGEFGGILVR